MEPYLPVQHGAPQNPQPTLDAELFTALSRSSNNHPLISPSESPTQLGVTNGGRNLSSRFQDGGGTRKNWHSHWRAGAAGRTRLCREPPARRPLGCPCRELVTLRPPGRRSPHRP